MNPHEGFGLFLGLNYWRAQTDDEQLKRGDRVRVTYEATVDSTSERGILVGWPGDSECAEYFTTLPAHATVEVLRPPTLAERMAALVAEFDLSDELLLRAAARRLRDELAAHQASEEEILRKLRERLAAEKASARQPCGFAHAGPWNLDDFCVLPAGHDGFCNRPNRTGANR